MCFHSINVHGQLALLFVPLSYDCFLLCGHWLPGDELVDVLLRVHSSLPKGLIVSVHELLHRTIRNVPVHSAIGRRHQFPCLRNLHWVKFCPVNGQSRSPVVRGTKQISDTLRKGALGSAKLEEECKENDEHWRQRDGPSQGNGPLGIEEGIILQGAILQPDQGKKHQQKEGARKFP